MLFDKKYIINLSGINADGALKRLTGAEMFDLSELQGTDCYLDEDSEAALAAHLRPVKTDAVHWIDEGDYHYLTKVFTDRIREPFSLLLFDHHPDCQRPIFGELLSCGGWCRNAVRSNPNLKAVLMVGIGAGSMAVAEDFADEFPGLKLDIIPERKLRRTPSADVARRLAVISAGLPVYVSLDKDVLSARWARTDWDQGSMGLRWLLKALKAVFSAFRILGFDICGGLSYSKGATPVDMDVNLASDKALNGLADRL